LPARIDREAFEVDVLYSQPKALHQAKSRAIQQRGDEPDAAIEPIEQRNDFVARENDRKALLRLRACRAGEAAERAIEDAFVEKHERIQRLVLRRSRYAPIDREMGQELNNVTLVHLSRMAQPVIADVVLHPVHVDLLGTERVVLATNDIAEVLQKRRRWH